jgi:hypothetical protein
MAKSNEIPNGLLHYTSLNVISIMLSDSIDNKRDTLKFHASHLQMMNDMNEGTYILDKFFSNSRKKTELKKEWNDYFDIHTPFVLSMIRSNISTVSKGILPMWKMYGDNGRGAYYRFYLKNFFNKRDKGDASNMVEINKCEYLTLNQRNEDIKWRNKLNNGSDDFDLLLYKSTFTKSIDWEYEREWRIVKYLSSEDALVKQSRYGVVRYTEIGIPILALKEICLGPMTNANDYESIKCLCNKVNRLFPGTEIKVTQSKLKVRL